MHQIDFTFQKSALNFNASNAISINSQIDWNFPGEGSLCRLIVAVAAKESLMESSRFQVSP
jgi:hypothetical protein